MNFTFKKMDNDICYYCDDEILYRTHDLAFIFDGNVLLKHGDYEFIRLMFNKMVTLYSRIPHELSMIRVSSDIAIIELQKVIDITDYMKPFENIITAFIPQSK